MLRTLRAGRLSSPGNQSCVDINSEICHIFMGVFYVVHEHILFFFINAQFSHVSLCSDIVRKEFSNRVEVYPFGRDVS